MSEPSDVTRILSEVRAGDERAMAQLLTSLYRELRRVASACLKGERAGHTLQPTALVHEAWMRLIAERERNWDNRGHFLSVASIAMRRVLMHYASKRLAAKRGGGRGQVTLFEVAGGPFDESPEDLLALDEALNRLAETDPRAVKIVEHRFFGGLTAEETAHVLGVSTRTVERDWRVTRAWLRKELERGAAE